MDYCTGPRIRVNHKTCHLSSVICPLSLEPAASSPNSPLRNLRNLRTIRCRLCRNRHYFYRICPPSAIGRIGGRNGGGTVLPPRWGCEKGERREGRGLRIPRAHATGLLSHALPGLHKVGRSCCCQPPPSLRASACGRRCCSPPITPEFSRPGDRLRVRPSSPFPPLPPQSDLLPGPRAPIPPISRGWRSWRSWRPWRSC